LRRGRPTQANLDAANIPFLVRNALKKVSAVWTRYSAYLLTEPLLKVQFLPGIQNVVADPFSRLHYDLPDIPTVDEAKNLSELFPRITSAARRYICKNIQIRRMCLLPDCKKAVPESAESFPNQYDTCSREHKHELKKLLSKKSRIDACFDITEPDTEDVRHLLKDFLKVSSPDSIDMCYYSVLTSPTPSLMERYRLSATPPSVSASAVQFRPSVVISPADQIECKELQNLRETITNVNHRNHRRNSLRYALHDNLLYHVAYTGEEQRLQLCVPVSKRKQILDLYHRNPLASHKGYKQTLSSILKSYYWPSIVSEVKRYVRSCHICTRVKSPLLRTPYVSPPTKAKFHTWATDWIGPLPAAEGCRYILTFLELSTGYIEAFPAKSPTFRIFGRIFLDEILSRYGCPQMLLSDLGSSYISSAFKYIHERLGVRISHSSSGNSRGNSLVERKQRDINNALMCCLLQRSTEHRRTKNWKLFLPAVLLALRRNKPTNCSHSPAELMYGKNIRMPDDLAEAKVPVDANRQQQQEIKDFDGFLLAF